EQNKEHAGGVCHLWCLVAQAIKIAEVERIAREKKELEYLKLLEAQRIAELQQAKLTSSAVKKIALADNKETGLNHTFTLSDNKENGLNTTFSKTTGPSQSSSTGKNKDSYDITPNSKKYKKNINNYDINDIESDDSTDEDSAPKRKIPPWAMIAALGHNDYNAERSRIAVRGVKSFLAPYEQLLCERRKTAKQQTLDVFFKSTSKKQTEDTEPQPSTSEIR
ncbi:Inner centromere protein B-like, partial [Homarus americanus]